ncbi:hypothetical protein OIU77_008408 [Salix suchowensis]|uniref:F-box associated beta-propeller type 1 domain-containing protein n=1 Tax=Salix suchowensis TaxID=1278906 RepID=A0ABQ9AKW4_9ROSI|nr:hypothetical protein OIU77_008408 [Salix suchowensis]
MIEGEWTQLFELWCSPGKTDSWRTVEDGALLGGSFSDPVTVKGDLYWKVSGERNYLANEELVLAFDSSIDVFRRIELPCLINQSNPSYTTTITEFKGSLGLFVFLEYSSNSGFDFWVLNESRTGGNIRCCWTEATYCCDIVKNWSAYISMAMQNNPEESDGRK